MAESSSARPGYAHRVLAFGIRSYQHVLSPLLGPQCRYYPTCSNYALEALELHGAGKGLLLSVARIARCHPFCAGGHDPVPHVSDSSS
ncbi:MAG TPA: membrane protein insertion efficiency factor YidD [Pseudomonadales bacterium]